MSDDAEIETTEGDEAGEASAIAELLAAHAEPEAETEAPPPPPDAAEVEREQRIAARREAAMKAERAASERREERRALRRAEEINRAAEARIREADERDRVWAERQAAIRAGGLTGLEAHGFSLEELARQELEAKDPSALAARAIARAEAAEKRIEAWEAAQKAEQARTARARAREQETSGLVSYVASSDTAAAEMPDAWVVREADDFAEAYLAARGEQPTFAQVLGELDRRAELFQREREERAQRRRAALTPGNGTAGTERSTATGATRALGTVAGTRAAARRPLTPEEEDRAYRKLLQEQLDKESGLIR